MRPLSCVGTAGFEPTALEAQDDSPHVHEGSAVGRWRLLESGQLRLEVTDLGGQRGDRRVPAGEADAEWGGGPAAGLAARPAVRAA